MIIIIISLELKLVQVFVEHRSSDLTQVISNKLHDYILLVSKKGDCVRTTFPYILVVVFFVYCKLNLLMSVDVGLAKICRK